MSRLSQSVLAAYYTDARLNIYLCLNDICEKTGNKPIDNDAHILSALDRLSCDNVATENLPYLIKQLRYRFPFIDTLIEKNPKYRKSDDEATPDPADFDRTLKWLFRLINDLRNNFVHPTDQETMIDHALHRDLFESLKPLYDGALRTVKTRFGIETETIKPLLRCGNNRHAKALKDFSFVPCVKPGKQDDKNGLKQSEVFHDFGHVLLCSLFLEKSQSAELIDYFWIAGHEKHWDVQQRNIITELLGIYRSRLPIQRLKSDHTETAVTLDTLSELSRCPRVLLNALSPTDQQRFRGGPSLLSVKTQTDEIDSDTSYLFARGHQNRFVPLMLRFFDFDPDNTLRFAIDLGQFYFNVRLKPGSQFTDGRSKVRRLGQKVVGYGRLIEFEQIDTKPDDWQQLEQQHSSSSEEAKAAATIARDAIVPLNPYLVPCDPHYHYSDDKIGLRLTEHGDTSVAAYPILSEQLSLNKRVLEKIKGCEMAPDFWISPAQLQQFAFYLHLRKTHPRFLSLDQLLKRYRSGLRKLLQTLSAEIPTLDGEALSVERRQNAQQWVNQFFLLKDGNNLSISMHDLPKVVVHQLLTNAPRNVSVNTVKNRVDHLLDETEKKLEHINFLLRGTKKRGQQGYQPIKCGHIGDFLVDDLLRFQPSDPQKLDTDGGKLNSQHYQILQAALAYYGKHIDETPKIVDLLTDAGLLSGKFKHPFLGQLNLQQQPDKYPGLISFYQAYLNKRKRFLIQYQESIGKHSSITAPPKWLRLKQQSTLDNWLEDFRDDNGQIATLNRGQLLQPLPVPKSLLYQPLLTMVAESLGVSPEELTEQGTQTFKRDGQEVNITPAVSWLIQHYLKEHQGDSPQAMYQKYSRHHRLFDLYLDKRTTEFQEKQTQVLTEKQRKDYLPKIRKFIATPQTTEKETLKQQKLPKQLVAYKRLERRIRHSSTQDQLLYLFAKHKLSALQLSDQENVPQWTLQEIEHTLLNTEIHYELPIPNTDKLLYHPTCKIRDRGALGLLIRDRRLESLITYYPSNETLFNHAEIRAELASYRREKVKIMTAVHRLEKEIVERCLPISWEQIPESLHRSFSGKHGKMLYALYHQMNQQTAGNTALPTSHFEKARVIRNKFSHSQYPDSQEFSAIAALVRSEAIPENSDNHRQIASKLRVELDRLYQPWFEFLDTLQ